MLVVVPCPGEHGGPCYAPAAAGLLRLHAGVPAGYSAVTVWVVSVLGGDSRGLEAPVRLLVPSGGPWEETVGGGVVLQQGGL